jgi:hypothetical protein
VTVSSALTVTLRRAVLLLRPRPSPTRTLARKKNTVDDYDYISFWKCNVA